MFESGSIYTIIGQRGSYLFEYIFYSTSTYNSYSRYINYSYSIYYTDSLTIDMNVDRTKGIISFPYSSTIFTYPFVANPGGSTTFNYYMSLNFCSANNSFSLYFEENVTNTFYQCPSTTLYISSQNVSSGNYNYRYVSTASDVTKMVGTAIGTAGFVYANSQAGAESGKTSKQGVIYKSYVNQQTWDTFN